MLRTVIGALAFAAIAALAPTASARTVTIDPAGYDVSSARGVSALHRDIVKAAKQVCRGQGSRGLDEMRLVAMCVENAVDGSVARSAQPTLVALVDALPENLRYSSRAYQLTPAMIAAVESAAGSRFAAL